MTDTQRGRPPKDDRRMVDNLDALEQSLADRRSVEFRPSSTRRSKLDWSDKDPNYYYRWFTTRESAIFDDTPQGGLELGYEFVRHKHGSDDIKGTKVTNTSTATQMYLMRIPKEKKAEYDRIRAEQTNMKDISLTKVGQREYGALDGNGETGKGTAIQQEREKQAYSQSDSMPLMR